MAFADTIRTARPTRENIATLIEQAGLAYPSYCTSVSGTNTITAICSGLAAYTAGFKIIFKGANNNTGAATINLNSLGAKSIKCPDGSALIGGEISTTSFTEAIYDGTNFILHSFSPVWTTWTTSYGTQAGSLSGMTTTYAKFKHFGDSFKYKILADAGSLSVTSSYLTFTLPKATATLGGGQIGFCYTFSSSNADGAVLSLQETSTTCRVYKDITLTTSGWPASTALAFYAEGEVIC